MSISIPNVSLREGQAVIPQGPNVINTTNGIPNALRPGGVRTIPLFRDYGKPVNDLITKGFPANYRIEVTTAQDNGLRFVFAAERRHDNNTNADSVFVSSQSKYDYPGGVNLVGTIDSEKLEGEVAFNNVGVTGVKAVFKGKFLDNDKTEASAEAQYVSTSLSGALGVFVKDDRSRLEAQVNALVFNDVTVGALLSEYLPTGTQDAAIDNFQVGANYTTLRTNFSTIFKGARNAKSGNDFVYSVGSRVLYNHSTSTTFGADVNYLLRRPFKELELKLVAEQRFDLNTTGKLGVERSGKVRLAIAQKLNNNFTLTLGAEFNALRLEEHNVGLTASFSA